ncbi:MAG: hypothetical protein IKB64_00935 [Paludibacteraceae bacterium]|nr:hypothetical protein [Paludibacteraceae bacterium]
MTTQAKLSRLIETKNAIRQKLISLGVDVPVNTPFEDYADLMKQLDGIDFIETTTDQELLQLLDLYKWLSTNEYEDYTYPDIEIQAVHNLLDTIIDGESKTDENIIEPSLEIIAYGKTRYYVDDVFDLSGYMIKAICGNGEVVDVTETCTVTPDRPLVLEDTFVTISCEIDGAILTKSIDISVVVFVSSLTVTREILDQGKFYNVTPTYLTNQVDGSDGFTIVGRNSSSSGSAKYSGNLRWTISLDLSSWNTLSFYARKNVNHGMIIVGVEVDGGTENLQYVHYNDGPTSWTKYTVDISKYDGVYTVFFIGGYTDSTGNTGSSTSYCNIIFSQ